MAAKIRRGDEVIVIAGKDKKLKKTGKVLRVLVDEHKVVVEGVILSRSIRSLILH